jgi:SAM-dependent methyltransferase
LTARDDEQLYTTGSYLEKNPLWHTEESLWKAEQVTRMLNRQTIAPRTICEVGCGAGEVLKQLQQRLTSDCDFLGCDISPQAIDLCGSRGNEKLHFFLGDVTKISDRFFDLILVLDVIEHLEDYFSFLRNIKERALYKIFQIPLDISTNGPTRHSSSGRSRVMTVKALDEKASCVTDALHS